uniref:Uncharacterized protein n=2 Tax=Oryza brachyantha TaxID=4533 RepID=J3L1J7_ORYBR
MGCQLSCAWDSCHRLRPADGKATEICFGQCYDGCRTTTTAPLLPRPLRAGAAGVHAAAWPAKSPDVALLAPPDDVDHHVFATVPDNVDHVFTAPPDDLDGHHEFTTRPDDVDHHA